MKDYLHCYCYDFLGSNSTNYENYRDDFSSKRLGV